MTTTSTPLGGLKTDVPLALLPVRLETRFVRAGTATQLLVRIYPDDVHADSHEPVLTQTEVTWGQHFWTQTWLAGNDTARLRATWMQLAEQFGGPRAAYIADTLQPLNPAARPAQPVAVLTTAPQFPTVTPRADGWSRAPSTRVLPDYWVAIGYIGSQRFTFNGTPIKNPLALSPTLAGSGFDVETMATDPNAGWLVDFAAAERAGMALRIPYPAAYGTPLDRLIVLGVKSGLTRDQGKAELEALLRGHRYTEGLAFALQGTPTNNTTDAVSGYSSIESAYVAGPLADVPPAAGARQLSAYAPGDGSNRDVTARALGIDHALLARVEHANDPEQRDAYHMNTALWKATWGYFLEQLASGPGSPSDAALRLGREHFSDYVRARGPLPAFRVGRQPYGVLPAISLDLWKGVEGGAIDTPIVSVLRGLRQVWRRSLSAVPRVPMRPDRAGELVKVLAMQPTSLSYTARPAQSLIPLGTTSTAGPIGSLQARELLASLGLAWLPRQLRTVFGAPSMAYQLTAALVQGPPPELLSEAAALQPNYLASLLNATWDDLRHERIAARPDVLLYALLRHAALQDYRGASVRILQRLGPPGSYMSREPDVLDGVATTTWTMLATAVPQLNAASVGAYLDAVRTQLRSEAGRDAAVPGGIWRRGLYDVTAGGAITADLADDLREFAALVRSVSYLSTQPTAVLARALAESLDLTSHRFDAWVTSFATKRLEWLRRQTPLGISIGAYGWVEDVTPVERTVTSPPTVTAPEVAPPEIAAPLYVSPGNQGYIHAPSLPHATTAAILRGGYLSRKAAGDRDVLAVDLSSQRVRTALWLLDGIRGGQSLSTLLGYRFERGLHENYRTLVLDRYIPSFRALAPQPGDLPTPRQAQGATESIAVRNVVDGLALLRRYRAGRDATPAPSWTAATVPFGASVPPLTTVVLPPAVANNAEFAAVRAELEALDAAVDSISDLTISEAVHQIAQGNPVRAGAVLEAIALGEAPPPDLHVIETPRTGIGLTHRLAVLFSGVPAATWGTATARSQAEPHLTSWAATLLGPNAPAAICRVSYVDTATGAPLLDAQGAPAFIDVTFVRLRMGPLDVVYLPESNGQPHGSELAQRIAHYALQPAPTGARPAGIPETAGVRLAFTAQPGWPASAVGLADVLEVARTIRRLLASSRAATPRDLALADAAVPASHDADFVAVGELPTAPERPLRLPFRADAAIAAFRAAAKALQDAIPPSETDTVAPDVARARLLAVAAFGVPGSVPLSPVGSGAEARTMLHVQVVSVARELAARLKTIAAIEASYARTTPTPTTTRDYQLARMAEVFGPEFRVLPRFAPFDATGLGTSFAASTSLLNNKPLEAVTWLQRAARVRDGAARLDAVLLYAEAIGGGGPNLKVAQLPYTTGDRWVALPPPATGLPGGRLSVVAHTPGSLDVAQLLAGLLVDEWVEVVPSTQETTGMTFHFNRPNARAPQAILLAVAPDERPAWDVETLETTILETLELAKLRAVDLSALGELGQYLPALYFAHGAANQTVTSDFKRLATGDTA